MEKVAEVFMRYDKDESGQIEFGERHSHTRTQLQWPVVVHRQLWRQACLLDGIAWALLWPPGQQPSATANSHALYPPC